MFSPLFGIYRSLISLSSSSISVGTTSFLVRHRHLAINLSNLPFASLSFFFSPSLSLYLYLSLFLYFLIAGVHNLFGQGPKCTVFSALEGHRQNYYPNSCKRCTKTRK